MSDKQKTETAAPAAPQEVNEEALDQVNGGVVDYANCTVNTINGKKASDDAAGCFRTIQCC